MGLRLGCRYTFNHPQKGGPKVCYLSIHGDEDPTIAYDGGPLFGSQEYVHVLTWCWRGADVVLTWC